MRAFQKTLIVFVVSLIFGVTAFAGQQKVSSTTNQKTELLYVMLAKKAVIKQTGDKQYQLTLYKVNPQVISFTDRPHRTTSQVKLDEFVKQWSVGVFQNDPPNAVMEAIRLHSKKNKSETVNYVVELTNPKYNSKNHSLTFNITPLKGVSAELPKLAKSDYVALFIDNTLGCSGLNCWNN